MDSYLPLLACDVSIDIARMDVVDIVILLEKLLEVVWPGKRIVLMEGRGVAGKRVLGCLWSPTPSPDPFWWDNQQLFHVFTFNMLWSCRCVALRRFLTKFNQESHSRGHLMAKHSKSLALQSFTSRFWDRKSEGTNMTLFLCSAKQYGQAHPQSALRRTNEKEVREIMN